jgi:hypothetical protein
MTSAGSPNQCTFPAQLYNAQSAALFGQCSFQGASAAAGLPLSDELLAAAAKGLASPAVPPRPARLLAEEAAFWAAMANGTKVWAGVIWISGVSGCPCVCVCVCL